MQSSIYLAIALVALCAAEQLKSGPKIQKEPVSSSKSPNSPTKRYATQEVILNLSPSEIRALQSAKSINAENQKEYQLSVQDYNDEQQQKAWSQYFKSLESEQSRERQDAFYSKSTPTFEKQNEGGNVNDFYLEQNVNKKSQLEREREESQWIPFNPESAKKQEEALLQDQLQQQWNILNNNRAQLRGSSVISNPEYAKKQEEARLQDQLQQQWNILNDNRAQLRGLSVISNAEYAKKQEEARLQDQLQQQWNILNDNRAQLRGLSVISNAEYAKKQEEARLQDQLQQQWNILNDNRAQLRGLSVISNENQKPEASNESERPVIEWQSVSKDQEEQKSEIQKEIESILRDASNVERQGVASENERYNQQRLPVVIHKEVRITKHHPVPVVERVKVSVPRPVLVPVPEPYEVKVPHPYPVPLEVVKHIPIPVIRNKYV